MDNGDYPIHIYVVSDMLVKHELFIDTDFLDRFLKKIIINALKSISKNKKVREMYQLDLDLNDINNVDVCRTLNIETRSRIWSTSVVTYHENDLVAIKLMQQRPGLKLANKYLHSYNIIKILQ